MTDISITSISTINPTYFSERQLFYSDEIESSVIWHFPSRQIQVDWRNSRRIDTLSLSIFKDDTCVKKISILRFRQMCLAKCKKKRKLLTLVKVYLSIYVWLSLCFFLVISICSIIYCYTIYRTYMCWCIHKVWKSDRGNIIEEYLTYIGSTWKYLHFIHLRYLQILLLNIW